MNITTIENGKSKITTIELQPGDEVCAEAGYISIWCAGREVRVGPLTTDQAEVLSDDLGYVAVAF